MFFDDAHMHKHKVFSVEGTVASHLQGFVGSAMLSSMWQRSVACPVAAIAAGAAALVHKTEKRRTHIRCCVFEYTPLNKQGR